jgi:Lipid desaturase domain
LVQLLQRSRLILSPEHHADHHAAPHTRNYCITVGWLNGPLRAVRFFETLERTITAVTGAVPREDDLGSDVALKVVAELSRDAQGGCLFTANLTAARGVGAVRIRVAGPRNRSLAVRCQWMKTDGGSLPCR